MNIGIEIELTGVTRRELATAFNNVWGYATENIWLTRKRYKNSDNSTLGAEFFWDYGIGSDADNLLIVGQDRSIKPYRTVEKDRFNPSLLTLKNFRKTPSDIFTYMNEIRTPVFDTENSSGLDRFLDKLTTACKAIGCCVNESCAIHIHIDAPKTDEDIIKIFKHWVEVQEQFTKDWGITSERLNHFAKLYRNTDKYNIQTLSDIYSYIEKEYEVSGRGLRYFALNFKSITSHNTIEFRLFPSTLDAESILSMVKSVEDFYNDCFTEVVNV